jgi:hypothetical protein
MKKYLAILFAGFVSHAWAGYDQGSGNSCSAYASDCGAAYSCSASSSGGGQNSLCDTISSYCSYQSGLNYYNCFQPANQCKGNGNGSGNDCTTSADCGGRPTYGGGNCGGDTGGGSCGDGGTTHNHSTPDLAGTAWLFGGALAMLGLSRRRLAVA